MMNRHAAFLIMLIFVLTACDNNSEPFTLNLYTEGEIPNYLDVGEMEVWDTTNILRISKVQVPDLKVYLPNKVAATGDAVIICPGGGYKILAYQWEGESIAEFWNKKGVAAMVLKYRLPVSEAQILPHKSPLMDAQRAMRLVRFHADAWGIDPEKIGIMGFSAGGHLASSLSTHYDHGNPEADDEIERESCRPDFSILMYPVISFTDEFQHSGSRERLVGEDSTLMEYFSSHKQVTEDSPPAILIHASDDGGVPVENSLVYYQALVAHGVPAEMHLYPSGGHGFSLAKDKAQLSGWPERCWEWLDAMGTE